MVSLSERDAIVSQAFGDEELAPYAKFLFGELEPSERNQSGPDPHLALLYSIANANKPEFQKRFDEIAARVINDDSGWVENDCLVFLLIIGCEKFAVESNVLDRILSAREKNRNPVAISTNSIFRALSRREYRMEGRYCFIKAVCLGLLDRFELNRDDLARSYEALTQPSLLAELSVSPFLQLLAVRAFDLLICKFSPTEIDSFVDVINAIHRLSPKMAVSQWWSLLHSVPVKMLLAIAAPIFTAGAIVGGYTYRAAKSSADVRQEPSPPTLKHQNADNSAVTK